MSRNMRKGMPGPGDMPKNPMKILGRILKFVFSYYRARYIIVFACIMASAACTLVGNLFLQSLIDDYITPMITAGSSDFSALAVTLVKMAGIFAIGIIATLVNKLLLVKISQGALLKLREGVFEHMQTLPIRYFDQNKHGDIMSVYTNDIDALRQFISSSLPEAIDSAITVVITFVSMCVVSWQLTIVSVLMIVITIYVTKVIGAKSGAGFAKQQMRLAALNGYVEEMVEGQKVVKVFCHEDAAIAGFEACNESLREAANAANGAANIIMPINNNISHMSYVLIAVVGSLLAISGSGGAGGASGGAGGLTLGVIVTFLSLNRSFSRPISMFGAQINSIMMAIAGGARIFELLDAESEVDEGAIELGAAARCEDADASTESGAAARREDADASTESGAAHRDADDKRAKVQGEIEISHVDFEYRPDHLILHDISLMVRPGEKVAFVGTTGAGKTTITNLINRFYDVVHGTITIDGIDIKKIKKSSLRSALGMVLQETNLFTGTVMENIRYGRLSATDEECIAAAKLSNAHSFIKKLPDGYNTMLKGGGAMLSQGERQLLSIARAAVADPAILILDEATSSIDTRTEALIQKGMDRLMKGRTTLVIAHRLSTVKDADKIVVLEGGRIIEQGSHDELLAHRGKYYTLYTGNFEEE